MATTESALFTIGHSNHPVQLFVDLLSKNNIQVVVDVRSAPYSRFVPQFNKGAIEATLSLNGFRYVFMGDSIGGKPADQSLYDENGQARYAELAGLPFFQQGIERLLAGLHAGWRIALMCAEENPLRCHRHLLIARELEFRHGAAVMHLRAAGRAERAKDAFVNAPQQMELFP